jgi:NADH:ubiquinone oxidoreductase subunit F (NADH-binding)/(2Fe-2S) ferredoxin
MEANTIEKIKIPKDIEAFRNKIKKSLETYKKTICVCIGPGCIAKGSMEIYEAFNKVVINSEARVAVKAKCTGCHGLCEKGPIVVIKPDNILYLCVEKSDVDEIFRESVLGNNIIDRLLYEDPYTKKRVKTEKEIPFYNLQNKIVLTGNGTIDPSSIEEYIAAGGFSALVKVLTNMTPEDVILEVEKSGLRGRGGGGFLTYKKWRSCRNAVAQVKYIIANGDEGDPGAFMDRALMEGNPYSIIEGMLIGGYAIGSSDGIIYVRNEYPIAVDRLKDAIKKAESIGLLGEHILGSTFSFNIKINRGGGAFVCGESTALIASLEGKIGEPRAKYIHTVESGLHQKPTNLNNVETWANVPVIINKGGEWFSSIGSKNSKGTKVFSLVGKVVNTGLVEVPMGITLREIIYDIGGGIKDGKSFKAVQTGGPSGGCIPTEYLDVPVDFDELTKLGSMMGSGGMIVMDEDTCMVNVARYFMNFLKEESCGKCTPCREGISQMLHILDRITTGEGQEGDLELLERLAALLESTSLCALGKTAAYPILSTLRYFRPEYEMHIKEKRCPAKECKGLFRYTIDEAACNGCEICKKNCPVDAITGERRKPHVIDQQKCTLCGTCLDKCPFNAVLKV